MPPAVDIGVVVNMQDYTADGGGAQVRGCHALDVPPAVEIGVAVNMQDYTADGGGAQVRVAMR